MKRLSNISQRSCPYLHRRNRLAQVCVQIPPRNQIQTDNSFNFPTDPLTTPRTISNSIHKQLITLSEYISADRIDLPPTKKYIEQSFYIGSIASPLLQILFLALKYQPVSKISNITYFLCLRSQNFRRALRIKLQDELIYRKNRMYSETVYLADMFFFGVCGTQNQFVENVVGWMFGVSQSGEEIMPKYDQQHMIHFCCHFFQAITQPRLLLKHHKDKFLSYLQLYLFSIYKDYIINISKQRDSSLRSLRIAYTDKTQQLQIPTKQQEFLQKYYKIHQVNQELIVLWRYLIGLPNGSQYEGKCRKFVRILGEEGVYEGFNENNGNGYDDINEEQLLMQIRSTCQNYKNGQYYQIEDIYKISKQPLKVTPIKPTIQNPIPLLPPQFLDSLNKCDTPQHCLHLAEHFLTHYNKSQNRETLVWQVYKKMHDRNNIPYIVRVLAEIGLSEPEIKYFINEKINRIRNRQSSNSSNCKPYPPKYFKQYSGLLVEFCKFGLFQPSVYLEDLLRQINNRVDIQQEDIDLNKGLLTGNVTANALAMNRAGISIPDIIDILSKMGRHIYYYSLQTHILFNQLIELIYEGIRSSFIAYQLQTISRFNSIVQYLRSINKNKSKNMDNQTDFGIPLESIKSQRKAISIAKKYAQNLKEKFKTPEFKDEISQIINEIEKSIDAHGYMESYYYADLIQKIRSKALDRAAFNMTENSIWAKIKKYDVQGAANWARFLGQLYAYGIIAQKDLLDVLEKIMKQYFECQKPTTIKIISSSLQTCKDLLTKTKSNRQINQSLHFLLLLKKELIKTNGLSNSILQHEIADIMQYFHPAFTHFRSVQDIQDFMGKTQFGKIQHGLDNLQKKKYVQARGKVGNEGEVGNGKLIGGKYIEETNDIQEETKNIQEETKNIQEETKNIQEETKNIQEETKEKEFKEEIEKKIQKENETVKLKKIKVIGRDRNGAKKISNVSKCQQQPTI